VNIVATNKAIIDAITAETMSLLDADGLSVHLDNALGAGNFSKDQYRQICDALTTKSAA
jgi:Leu/Phe-tRNA-protein transferase